ncbi:MAG: nicotinate-nucleotide--dimethylbenzimidazole phosphoribosyltransferase [Methylophilaceae bacterium]|nr:nicotinate-nucleotide--dimethylbenzimidazole phosphoribosyltransferase [Methylophilaceae bacterium]
MQFDITAPDNSIAEALAAKINQKTKPLGALGRLEQLALQIGVIQHTLTPQLKRPVVMVFAGDHGIVEAGVSPYPQAVTQQMVMNFLAGGAGVNVFAKQNNMQVRVIDAGVNHVFAPHVDLIDAKVGMGTCNFAKAPAMSAAECEQAISKGAELAEQELAAGSNVLAFGEMGIGNTSSAAALMAVLCELPVSSCVGRGTGLDDAGLNHKAAVIEQAIQLHQDIDIPLKALSTFGGFEIAMMVGAMLATAKHKSILMIDGFIATAALLVASKIEPAVLHYCVFAHRSDESGHALLLEKLNAKPLLQLNMRLGEGTGAVMAYPLLQAAVNFLNEMASFESAHVSGRSG